MPSDRLQSYGELATDEEPCFGTYKPRGAQRLLQTIAKASPLHRGLFRRPMANLIRSLSPNGVVDVEFRGGAFRLRKENNLSEDAILIYPDYNTREIDFLIEGTPCGGAFIDLGSNVGLYSLALAAHIGSAGTVLAIDANPDMTTILEYNIKASGFEHVRVVSTAVGATDSRADLCGDRNDLAIVYIKENPAGKIQIRPLADIVQEAGLTRIDSLKADIEGFEDQALIPYLNSVEDELKPRRVVVEHLCREEWQTDLVPVFKEHGYRLVESTRGNYLFERDGCA